MWFCTVVSGEEVLVFFFLVSLRRIEKKKRKTNGVNEWGTEGGSEGVVMENTEKNWSKGRERRGRDGKRREELVEM